MLYICASVLAPLQVSTFLSPQTPAQIFWHIAVQKKWHKLSKLGGGGEGGGNLDKIQKNRRFSSWDLPLDSNAA